MVSALFLMHQRLGWCGPPLLEALQTAKLLPPAGALTATVKGVAFPVLPPPLEKPHRGDELGVASMLREIQASLLKIEDVFFARPPPCNSTACNQTSTQYLEGGPWRGRHGLAARRQILSVEPEQPSQSDETGQPAGTPTPPDSTLYTPTPGPDGFYDSAPDDDLPAP